MQSNDVYTTSYTIRFVTLLLPIHSYIPATYIIYRKAATIIFNFSRMRNRTEKVLSIPFIYVQGIQFLHFYKFHTWNNNNHKAIYLF